MMMMMMSPRRRVLPSMQSDVDIVVANITLTNQNAGKEHQGGREKRREKRRHPQSPRRRRSSFSAFLVVWGDLTFVVVVRADEGRKERVALRCSRTTERRGGRPKWGRRH